MCLLTPQQQTIEREQEREEFQREIVRLEEDQRSKDKTPSNVDELFRKEVIHSFEIDPQKQNVKELLKVGLSPSHV